MPATYMLRKHLAAIESAGKPEAIAERAIHQKACKKARAEVNAKFPVLTVDNFEIADSYQKERISYWKSNK